MYTNYYVDYSILDYHMTVQTIIYDIYILPILDIISYHIISYKYHIPMTPGRLIRFKRPAAGDRLVAPLRVLRAGRHAARLRVARCPAARPQDMRR